MAVNLIYLVYVSSAVELFTEEDLLALLNHSRERNQQSAITGMLLYSSGNFMQVIEGNEKAVVELHQKILADPRHTNVITLLKRSVAQRLFPNWSMGFKNLDQLTEETTPGYSRFLQTSFTSKEFEQHPERAHRLLLSFRESMR
jgi:hypothetical protein